MLINGKQQEQILIKGGEEQIDVEKREEQKTMQMIVYADKIKCKLKPAFNNHTGNCNNMSTADIHTSVSGVSIPVLLHQSDKHQNYPPAPKTTLNHQTLNSTDLRRRRGFRDFTVSPGCYHVRPQWTG